MFQSLPFEKVQHKITTLDAQPSSPGVASMIVSVTGLLMVSRGLLHIRLCTKRGGPLPLCNQVDDSPNPLQFSQVFQLIPDGGSYYVYVPPVTLRAIRS